jgi:hypothetical protein
MIQLVIQLLQGFVPYSQLVREPWRLLLSRFKVVVRRFGQLAWLKESCATVAQSPHTNIIPILSEAVSYKAGTVLQTG